MKKGDFKLYICNMLPESLFVKQFGNLAYNIIAKNTVNKGFCSACGHEPLYTEANKSLQLHIYQVDKKNPQNSKGVYLCKACHLTQHISNAIEGSFVTFVNSSISQNSLNASLRYGDLRKLYQEGKIVNLKKTPEQFLKEIKTGVFKISPTLKVVFTNKFEFNDK